MVYFLRAITKSYWRPDPEKEWLNDNELQSQVFRDLKTTNNRLSVWRIDKDQSQLNRIVAALTANQDAPSSFDFAILLIDSLSKINVHGKQIKGETPDQIVNTWHYDLVNLNLYDLSKIAHIIHSESIIDRFSPSKVRKILKENIAAENLAIDKIKIKSNTVRSKIGLPLLPKEE